MKLLPTVLGGVLTIMQASTAMASAEEELYAGNGNLRCVMYLTGFVTPLP